MGDRRAQGFGWVGLWFWLCCFAAQADSYHPYYHFDPLKPHYIFDWARITGNPEPRVQEMVPQSWSQDGNFLLCAEFYSDRATEVIKSLVLLDMQHENSHRIFVTHTKELESQGIVYTWDVTHTVVYYQMSSKLNSPFLWSWNTRTQRYRKLPLQTGLKGYLRSMGIHPKTRELLISLDEKVYAIDTTKPAPYPLKPVQGMTWNELDSFVRYHQRQSSITQTLSSKGKIFKTMPNPVTVFPFPHDPDTIAVTDSVSASLSVYTQGQQEPLSQVAIPGIGVGQLPPSALSGQWHPKTPELVFTAKHVYQAGFQNRKLQNLSSIASLSGNWEAAQVLFSPQGSYLAYLSILRSQDLTVIDVLKTPS